MSSVVISNFHTIIFEHHQIFQEVTAPHVEKKGYSLVNARCLKKIQACRYVVQDCSNESNLRIGISLHTPKINFEPAKRNRSFALTVKTSTQGAFQIFRLLSVDRTFRGSSERTNCLICPYRGEEMNQLRDFLDFLKFVHRKKAHLLLMSR